MFADVEKFPPPSACYDVTSCVGGCERVVSQRVMFTQCNLSQLLISSLSAALFCHAWFRHGGTRDSVAAPLSKKS